MDGILWAFTAILYLQDQEDQGGQRHPENTENRNIISITTDWQRERKGNERKEKKRKNRQHKNALDKLLLKASFHRWPRTAISIGFETTIKEAIRCRDT